LLPALTPVQDLGINKKSMNYTIKQIKRELYEALEPLTRIFLRQSLSRF
jgi:hypothetical protein